MKKINLLLIAISIISLTTFAQEKAFQKGKITISVGAGFGVYGTKSYTQWDSVYGGSSYKATRTKNDGAASGIYPINLEYGITNWLGIGARFGFSKYAVSDTVKLKPTVTGWDGDLNLFLHFVKTKRFDMPVQLTAGYSSFKYLSNDLNGSMAKGGGINYAISLVPRIYFGNHIGMYFNLGYAGYNYPNLILSDNKNTLNNLNYTFKLKANGVNLGLGLIVKLH